MKRGKNPWQSGYIARPNGTIPSASEESELVDDRVSFTPMRSRLTRGHEWHRMSLKNAETQRLRFEDQRAKHTARPKLLSSLGLHSDLQAQRRDFLAARPLTTLWPRQEEGVAFMTALEERENGGFVSLTMRKGKTLLLLTHVLRDIQNRVRRGDERYGAPTLFFVPPQAMATTWHEIEKHLGTREKCPLRILEYQTEMTLTTILEQCDILIVSYSLYVSAFHKASSLLTSVYFLRIIADESHLFSNPHNILFKAMMALKARYRWCVTGTPVRNSARDLVSALEFLRVPEPIPSVDDPAFRRLLSRIMFRRTASEGPGHDAPVDDRAVFIQFHSNIERELYDALCSRTADEVRRGGETSDIVEGGEVDVAIDDDAPPTSDRGRWKLNLILRLRQVCVMPRSVHAPVHSDIIFHPESLSAAAYLRDAEAWACLYPKNQRWLRDPRQRFLDRLAPEECERMQARLVPRVSTKQRYILEYFDTFIAPSDEKLIVFSEWASFLDDLAELFACRAKLHSEIPCHVVVHGGITERSVLFDRFRNDPTCKVLLLTFGTGGTSLDLSCANHAILPDPWFNPFTEDQVLARLGGVNQTRPMHFRRLFIQGTIDEEIMRLAQRKRALQTLLDPLPAEAAIPTEPLRLDLRHETDSVTVLIDYILATHSTTPKSLKRKRTDVT